MSQKVTFTSGDDVLVVANWTAAPTTLGAVILVHTYPTTKETWAAFQTVLMQRGLASLAIDLRGHGESTKTKSGRVLDYRKFTDDEHRSCIEDIRAAYEWIVARGIERDRVALVGASFGANLSFRLLAEEPQIPAAVLLSPGLSYHGITTPDVAELVNPHQSVQIIVSRGDDDESVAAADKLISLLAVDVKEMKRLMNAGHGTHMFESDAALMGETANWIRDRLQSAV